MTHERRNLITSRQLMILIISSQVGMGVISVPHRLANDVGHDGWVVLLFSGIASIILSILLIKLLERYKDKSIYDINRCLYGKYMGSAINTGIILYLALKAMVSLRLFVEVIQTIILKETPAYLLTFFLFLPTLYLSWYGLKALCNFSNMVFISMIALLLLCIVNFSNIRTEFLRPVFVCTVPDILRSMFYTAYSFLGFVSVVIFYPYVKDKDKTLKYIIGATASSTLFFIFVFITLTGFFGENMLKHLVFPIYSLAGSYEAPIFERIDLFFMVIWFPAMAMTLRMYFFATYHSVNRVFNIQRKTISIIIISVLLILISRIPRDFNQVYKYLSLTEILGIPLDFGLAALNFVLSFLITKGVSKKS